MKRIYKEPENSKVDYFVGTEVEKSSAHGLLTLFVVGLQELDTIAEVASKNNIAHIYLGANMSFDGNNIEDWVNLANGLLNKNYWVTLDYKLQYHQLILEYGLNESNQFISMISIPLPYIDQLNYNACLKLDDTTFQYSNPGVWVHSVHELKDKNCFTDWSKYKNDTIVV